MTNILEDALRKEYLPDAIELLAKALGVDLAAFPQLVPSRADVEEYNRALNVYRRSLQLHRWLARAVSETAEKIGRFG